MNRYFSSGIKLSQKYLTNYLLQECELACSIPDISITPQINQDLFLSLDKFKHNPMSFIEQDIKHFNESIQHKVKTGNSDIDDITQYYFRFPGKNIRPAILLLLARALNRQDREEFPTYEITESQKTFAQVIEMVHVSSLIHDDVIDKGEIRRGQTAIHLKVGNRNAVLGGDYLISTASFICTELEDMRLLKLLSRIFENLAKGELIQAQNEEGNQGLQQQIINYCHKTYFKTASMIAYGCEGIGLQVDCPEDAHNFGKHLGLAFQYVDDILDFTSDKKTLGKPNLNDMKEGLATGPVLFASKDDTKLQKIILRKFQEKGDIEYSLRAANQIGLDKTRYLALQHLHKALDSLHKIPKDSFAYEVLASLAAKIYNRVS
jgi:geranylgeranyl pyrophosphate synthase